MSRGRPPFTRTNLTRALTAAKDAGYPIQRFLIRPDGAIELVLGEPEATEADTSSEVNEWDTVQ
jgi:hypothetical protein